MEKTVKIIYNKEYFNILSTLTCGQVFRFYQKGERWFIFSKDKCAILYYEEDNTIIECRQADRDYFYNYFDLDRDYSRIYNQAIEKDIDILTTSAKLGKGIRILNQDKEETIFSFIISQNNNIPRIKSCIEKLCSSLGEKKSFIGENYFSFPSVNILANAQLQFYKSIGLGYRAEYIKQVAQELVKKDIINDFEQLSTIDLKKELIKLKGIGPKVAECITLFAFHRSDSFPVDTWIEKVYRENFKGKQKDIRKISEEFLNMFKENAGYFQQYLFHYKRNLTKKGK